MLVGIEILALIITIVLAIFWIRDQGGNYEPWTVVCGAITGSMEIIRQWKNRKTKERSPSKAEDLANWAKNKGADLPLSELLPHVLRLSKKIGNEELEHWVRMELYGYDKHGGMREEDVVPEYREISGKYIDAFNNILVIDDPDLAFVNTYRFRLGVKELEELSNKSKMQNIRDENFVDLMRKQLKVEVLRFCFSPVSVAGVLNRIRNHLLEKIEKLDIEVRT